MGNVEYDKSNAMCPRCGYDLRGEVQAWMSQCPLRGRCPECGVEFAWGEVVDRVVHPWLFEHQWRRHPVRSLVTTVWRSFRPRRFFEAVRMEHASRPWAMLALLTIAFLLAYTLSSTTMTMGVIAINASFGGPTKISLGDCAAEIGRDLVMPSNTGLAAWASNYYSGPLCVMLALPALLVLVPVTLRRARVRIGHMVRAAAYSLLLPLLVCSIHTISFSLLLIYQGWWLSGQAQPPAGGFVAPPLWSVTVLSQPQTWQWFGGSLAWADEQISQLVILSPFLLWGCYWWSTVCNRYLRLPHATGMAIALVLIVGLAAVAWQLVMLPS